MELERRIKRLFKKNVEFVSCRKKQDKIVCDIRLEGEDKKKKVIIDNRKTIRVV